MTMSGLPWSLLTSATTTLVTLVGGVPGGEPGGELGGEPALSTAPRSTRGARRVGIGEQGASGDGGDACVACGPGNNCCRC